MVGPRVGEIYYGQLVINVKEEVEDVIGEQIRIRKLIAFQGGVSMREDFYKPKQHIEEERKEPEAGFGKSNATIDTTYTSSTCASSNTRDTKNNKNRHKHKRKPHDKHDIKRLVQERADRDSQRLHRIQILQEEKQKKEKKIEQAKEEFDKLLFTDSGWGTLVWMTSLKTIIFDLFSALSIVVPRNPLQTTTVEGALLVP